MPVVMINTGNDAVRRIVTVMFTASNLSMLADALLWVLIMGLPLAVLACLLNAWFPKHMAQQEAILVAEVLEIHGSSGTGAPGSGDIEPARFWRMPEWSVLNAVCALCSLFAVLLAVHYGSTGLQTLLWAIWGVALVVLAFIDARTKLLPDALTLPLLWFGLVIQLFPETRTVGLELSVIGAVAGYLPLWLLAQTYRLIRGRDGLGMGDLKLLAAMGAWSGPFMLPQVLLLAALLAITLFVIERVVHRSNGGFHEERPFGPAIVAAYFIVLLFTL